MEAGSTLPVPSTLLLSNTSQFPLWSEIDSLARAQVAQSRFWRRCQKAFERDLQAISDQSNRNRLKELRSEFFSVVSDLMNPDQWRLRFLSSADRPRMSADECDTAVPALVDFFEGVLQPWFEGKATLDYGNLRRWRHQFGFAKPSPEPTALISRRRPARAKRR